jgi:hypothetical protein
VGEKYDLTWHMAKGSMKLVGTVDGQEVNQPGESECYFDEMVGFIKAVQNNDQSLIRSSYADACKTLAVCEAGTNAIASGSAIPIRSQNKAI